jgi:class 3 adenylate cyclase
MVPVEGVRWLADRLPSATVKLIESSSRLGSGPPLEAVLDEVGDFIQGTRVASKIRTEVTTLLVTDVVSSTATIVETGDHSWTHLLDSHRKLVRAALARFGGVEIDTAGDGFMTKFKSPSSAIRCALELIGDAETSGYRIRAAVHTSEITVQAKNVTGIGVHIAARVAAVGEPSKVLTTDAVRILLLGSDFKFIPRGRHSLKGVPGSWDLFAVTASTGTE